MARDRDLECRDRLNVSPEKGMETHSIMGSVANLESNVDRLRDAIQELDRRLSPVKRKHVRIDSDATAMTKPISDRSSLNDSLHDTVEHVEKLVSFVCELLEDLDL